MSTYDISQYFLVALIISGMYNRANSLKKEKRKKLFYFYA